MIDDRSRALSKASPFSINSIEAIHLQAAVIDNPL